MDDETDFPLSEKDRALAHRGEELIRTHVASVQAPHSLREAIENDRVRAQRTAPSFWQRFRVGLVTAGAAAVVLAGAMVALQSGGGNAEPTLASVDAVAGDTPVAAAPVSLGGDPPVLDARVGELQFPDWEKKFAWKASGSREDEIAGQAVKTVFYTNPKGGEIGYAVVSGEPLDEQPAGREVIRDGKTYHVAGGPDRSVVTWTQQGHTCVIVADPSVPQSGLLDLAASRNV